MEVSRGTSLIGEFYDTEGELIRLTLGNFDYQRGGFKHNTSKDNIYFSGKVKDEYILNEGDIITPLTEQTAGLLGSTARIPESGKYIQSQDVALIRCKEDLLDPTFCYYLLPSASVKKQLGAAAQQTKIRHTTPDRIKEVIVDIPPLAEQKAIGKILDSITAKIDLNYSLNHYLEAMAKQLYDYWFKQFDFPDENGRPYKSSGGKMVWDHKLKMEIPEGWDVVSVGDILDKYPATKKYETKEYQTSGLYPIIDQGDQYIVGYTNEDSNLLNRLPAVLFGDHSTKVKLLDFPFARGADGTQILYSNTDRIQQYYLYHAVLSMQIPNPGYSRHFKYLKEMPIIKPDLDIATKFDKAVTPIYKKWTALIHEVNDMSKHRDELLPLLMNGQVSVKQLNNDL